MSRRVLGALSLVLLPCHVFGQGTLLWEVQQDFHGESDAARAITLSGKVAVIAGDTRDPRETPTLAQDMVVQAFSKKKGTLEWSDQILDVGTCCPERVVSHKNRAFVATEINQPGQLFTNAFIVRAYDVPTRALLWENVWTSSSASRAEQHFTDIAAGPTAVVVVGYGRDEPNSAISALARAYDPLTGTVLWERRIGGDGFESIPRAVAVNQNRVFMALTTAPGPLFNDDTLLIRAYDALSGNVDWEFSRPRTQVAALELESGRLFVAGTQNSPDATTYLAALSARTGAPLWEGNATEGRFLDIAVKGSRLVGITSSTGYAVQAYNADTGTLEWQDGPTNFGFFLNLRMFTIDLSDNAVYVGGQFSKDFFWTELMVRAYHADTGTLLWDDRSHWSGGGTLPVAAITGIAVGKNRLFVAGRVVNDIPTSDFIVRAYDIRTDGTTLPPPGECIYTLQPSTQAVGPEGGSFTASVSILEVPPLQCAWTAVRGSTRWVHILGNDATGEAVSEITSGPFTYRVQAQSPGAPARSGYITLIGFGSTETTQLLVTQEAAAPAP